MGTNFSKSEDRAATAPRRSVRSGPSLNLLKRTRTSLNAARRTQAQLPVHPVPSMVECEIKEAVVVHQPDRSSQQTHDATCPETYSEASFNPASHHATLSSGDGDVGDASDVESNVSEVSHHVRPYTPVNIERDALSMSGSEDSRTGTPALSLTPKTRPGTLLPPPSMLPEDSPTKYGLRDMLSPAPDIALLTQAQRKKMTGPGLFVRTAGQLKTYHNARESDLDRRTFSHSSPCLLSSNMLYHNTAQQASVWSSRRGSCGNLLSENSPAAYKVVHALPMLLSQLDCFHQHDEWHAASQPGYNYVNAVSCTVCDGYDEEMAGDDFRRCNFCWLMVCGKCHDAFLHNGLDAMLSRRAGTPDTGRSAVATRE